MKPRRIRTLMLATILLGFVAVDGILIYKRYSYRAETARLREGMSDMERLRTDAIVAAETDRTDLMIQLVQRQAVGDDALHLAVSSESSYVALDRGNVRLRTMPAQFGPERMVGVAPDTFHATVPQGMRRVERTVGVKDTFELPRWVFVDRQLPIPEARSIPGWLGDDAIVASGGTVLYSMPASGPLADSTYVMPGAIRLAKADLFAIRESVTPGMRVYFY